VSADRPLLLDLFCGAGGAAKGYYDAGFDIVGIDNVHQPRYPYAFIRGDAIVIGASLLSGRHPFTAVHASPPCHAFTDLQKQSKIEYLDFIPQTRELLEQVGLPYIIENVEKSPLLDPVRLCGAMFPQLRVYRHRLFESSLTLSVPEHPKHSALVFTHDKRKHHYGRAIDEQMFVQVTGGGNAPVAHKLAAMGIDWMIQKEVNQAIPPAYTQFLGAQLMAAVRGRAAA
jgi:DNA (cytosine-5)-methyltransferase 1